MSKEIINEKKLIVDELAEKMKKAQAVIFYDYIGLTVAEATELRNQFRAKDIEYKVIKNTMLKRAADALEYDKVDDYLKGPTAVAFSYDDPVAPAKILSDFVKKLKKTQIKSGILNGKVMDVKGVESLATLPSREELLSKMLGSLNAPITSLVMALSGVPRNLVYALNAVKNVKEN